MTAYSGQLAHDDLATLAASVGPASSWALRILAECRTILQRRDGATLDAWAQALDAVLEQRSAARSQSPLGRGVAGGHDLDYIHLRARPIALEVNAGRFATSDAPTEAELYAVFALWKLVDRMQLQAAPQNMLGLAWLPAEALRGQQLSVGRLIQQQEADALLAAAVHASATAWNLAMTALLASARTDGAAGANEVARRVEEGITAALKKLRSDSARVAADKKHGKPGGSRDKREAIRSAWASGKYSSRDLCAEQECEGLGMSFATARKALQNTPDPT